MSWLIEGAGGSGTRTDVSTANQFWPNAFFDQRQFTLSNVLEGTAIPIPYYHTDRGAQQTISFALDTDTNPYNDAGNSAFRQLGSVTQSSRPAGSIGADSFDWTPGSNQTGTRYIQIKTTNNRSDGISRVRYDYYLKALQIIGAVSPSLTISSVTPNIVSTKPIGQTSEMIIRGTGYTTASRLTFNDGTTDYTNKTPTFINSTELRYNISVGPAPATWTVWVNNGSVYSLPSTFDAVSSGAQLTGLSISGPATVAETGSASFSASALFSDGSTQSGVAATWSENSSATSISSAGQLSAGSVSADTVAMVSASYIFGGVTKSASTSVTVVNGGSGGGTQITNVIVNGTFESGDTPWGPSGYADVVNLNYPRSGSWYAYVGNADNASGSLAQFFPIPSSTTAATLQFYIDVVTTETTTTTKFDYLRVDLATGGDQYVGTIAEFTNLDKGDNVNGTYVLKSYNIMPLLNAYKGQSLFLVFSGTTDSSKQTIFRVDDVKLDLTTSTPVTLTGLSISGASTLLEGRGEAYNAQAIFSDGTSQTVSPNSWSENSSATSIDSSGFLIAAQVSSDTTATISTSYIFGGVTKQATKQVTVVDSNAPVTFTSLVINGSGSMNESATQQCSATAVFSNGSTQTVTPSWSEDSFATSITTSGLLSAGSVSSDTAVIVSASHVIGGITRTASLAVLVLNSTIVVPTLSSLSINGANSVAENATGQFTATATFSDGTIQTVDPTWSENNAVTSISTFGLLSVGNVTSNVGVTVSATITIDGVTRSASKSVTITDMLDTTAPGLSITSHVDNTTVSSASITVSGSAGDGGRGNNGISSVTVNGVAAAGGTATGSGVAYWSRLITLNVGANTITVVAKDSFNNAVTQQVLVTYNPSDTQAPLLVISAPANNAIVTTPSLPVSGTATDGGRGGNGISSVTVNGVGANGGSAAGLNAATWNATIALTSGANTVTVIAKDQFSNSVSQQIIVTYNPTLVQYTVTPAAGANGSISPTVPQTVNSGGSVGLSAVPTAGYVVDQWIVNSVVVQSGGNTYTVSNVTGDHSVQVTFKLVPGAGTLFSDDFNDNSMHSSKWFAAGNAVVEANGMMQVLTTVTDAGGNVSTLPVRVNQSGLISVSRKVFLHYANEYFAASMNIEIGSLPRFGVHYENYAYSGPFDVVKRGFFITRNNTSAHGASGQANVSSAISPVWDSWFNEKVTYDPVTGQLVYYINDVSQMSFDVGGLPQSQTPTIKFSFDAWGWWTGHEQLMDDIVVTQVVGASSSPVKAQITNPPNGSKLNAPALALAWNAGVGVTSYYLFVGTTPGGYDVYAGNQGSSTNFTVPAVPVDKNIHVTLYSLIAGAYQANHYTFKPVSAARGTLVSPANGSSIAGGTLNLNWSAGTGVTSYYIFIGSAYGGYDLGAVNVGTANAWNLNVPQDGGPIYITLYSLINGSYQGENYWFNAALPVSGSRQARVTSPANTSALASSTMNLTWDAGTGVTSYALWVGSTPNGYDLYSGLEGMNLAKTVAIPGDGRRIHVTLHSLISGVYQSNAYWITAPTLPDAGAAQVTSPANGSTLVNSSLPLTWSSAAGATQYYIFVGNSPGASDLYAASQGTALTRTVTGLPVDGRPIYVTLYSWLNSAWKQSTAWFTTANTASGNKRALISGPANGSTLPGALSTFNWGGGVGMTSYALWIGSSAGAYDLWSSAETVATTSRTVTLPTDGRKLYVTLYSFISGAWQGASYLYTASNVAITKAAMTSPVNGSTFSGASQTFNWSASNAATTYALWIGRYPGGYDIHASADGLNLSKTVNTLPTDGSPVYVTLYSLIKGAWQSNEYIYNAVLPP